MNKQNINGTNESEYTYILPEYGQNENRADTSLPKYIWVNIISLVFFVAACAAAVLTYIDFGTLGYVSVLPVTVPISVPLLKLGQRNLALSIIGLIFNTAVLIFFVFILCSIQR